MLNHHPLPCVFMHILSMGNIYILYSSINSRSAGGSMLHQSTIKAASQHTCIFHFLDFSEGIRLKVTVFHKLKESYYTLTGLLKVFLLTWEEEESRLTFPKGILWCSQRIPNALNKNSLQLLTFMLISREGFHRYGDGSHHHCWNVYFTTSHFTLQYGIYHTGVSSITFISASIIKYLYPELHARSLTTNMVWELIDQNGN